MMFVRPQYIYCSGTLGCTCGPRPAGERLAHPTLSRRCRNFPSPRAASMEWADGCGRLCWVGGVKPASGTVWRLLARRCLRSGKTQRLDRTAIQRGGWSRPRTIAALLRFKSALPRIDLDGCTGLVLNRSPAPQATPKPSHDRALPAVKDGTWPKHIRG